MRFPQIRHFVHDESGQAILEFVLLLLVMISIVTFLKVSVKNLTVKLWAMFGRRIGAPCATCDAGGDFAL